MDRVRTVLGFQWRAYWRRVRRAGNMSTNNVGLLVIVGGIALIRFFQQLPVLQAQLEKGNTTRFEAFLLVAFLVWLLPVTGESRRSISARALLHLPLSTLQLYAIRVGSVLISPFSWAIVICSLILSYFVSAAPNSVAAVTTLWLFLLLGFLTSVAVTDLFAHAVMRRLLLLVLILATFIGGLSWFGSIGSLNDFLPNRLAARVAISPSPWRQMLVIVLLIAVAFVISLVAFSKSLEGGETKRTGTFGLLTDLPGRFGGLIKKDVRYAFRLLDVYLVLPVLIVMDIYLVSNPEPAASVVWASTIALLFPLMALAFNSFGLDSSLGMDRYRLLPLSGRQLLVTKNGSVSLIVILLFSLMWPLVVWKLGWSVAAVATLLIVLGLLGYFSFGNWMTVKQPYRMQFYRFASGGSVVDALMGLMLGSLPCVIAIFWLVQHGYAALWRVGLMVAIYVVIYILSLNRSARALENRSESIRAVLT